MRRTSTLLHGLLLGVWAGLGHADCYAHDGVLAKNSAYYTEDFEMVSYFATHGGTLLVDCGKNMYCCGAGESDNACCNDDNDHFFVDPETGEVKHPSKATDSSSSSSTAPPSSTPTNTDAPKEDESKGISAGAGAGIGIGAAAGVAIIAGLAWWLLKRRKQQNVYEAPAEQQHANGAFPNGAYANEPKHNDYYAHTGAQPAQAATELPPQELDGMMQRSEMHGESSRV
ncbi:hypothetical protein SLS60_004784 [Paraconiothyrium brasiliense]|uniref:Uncharacterized protein n=1 Tax=Paraconiothyrium brasiliense TaxID=300254 RepID=A0ABR3RLC3_9PLEO